MSKVCGIIGYIGNRNANEIVLKGIKRLEYRGYDSVGTCFVTKEGIVIKKDVGKIEEVHKKLNFLEPESNIGVGHTRWATHGGVTKENAHPHLDCKEKIAIVHNGIIENYQEIKEFLKRRGHEFKSQTDSEVIAHLIEEFNKRLDFESACKKAFYMLQGSFAVLVVNKDEEKIIGIRKDSPLVIGINENESFVASDIYALLPFTKNFIFLQNYDFVVLEKGKVKIENLIDGKFERKVERIDINIDETDKKDFHHYMIKEILEQADVFERAFDQDEKKIGKFIEEIIRAKKIFLVAAGTSYHASLAGSYLFSKAGIFAKPVIASEFNNFLNVIDEDTLIIAVSQSGETADVLDAIRKAKERKAKIFSIVNVYGSSLTRESDEFLLMNAGFEIGVAATKTYIAELAIFLLLYSKLTNKKINKEEIKAKILDLLSRSRREHVEKVAELLKDKQHIFLIGRGLEYVTALEAALKIKEISYIHAEAFPGGEIKHGTIALIEKNTPCIVFVGEEKEKILSNAEELKARGGFIIGVSEEKEKIFDIWIKVPQDGEASLIYQIIPMQLLAYRLAVLRGFDPDKPRNLAKSVTVL
ncbi:MAG: glutamine--fructose-6-phosphate transaminase (isomerizing) [Candidatus Aenigmatarchaeota archaeon]